MNKKEPVNTEIVATGSFYSDDKSIKQKKNASLKEAFFLEVTPGFEPGNQGFADPCLTTWLCHHRKEKTLTC